MSLKQSFHYSRAHTYVFEPNTKFSINRLGKQEKDIFFNDRTTQWGEGKGRTTKKKEHLLKNKQKNMKKMMTTKLEEGGGG